MMLNDFRPRPGTSDEYVAAHVNGDYGKLRFPPGATVLDMGAHVGLFTNLALERGARHVYAVEPAPDNLIQLRRHTTGLPVTVIAGAVVEHDSGRLPFYVKTNGHQSGNSLEPARAERDVVWVDSVPFARLCAYEPNVVKCATSKAASMASAWNFYPIAARHSPWRSTSRKSGGVPSTVRRC